MSERIKKLKQLVNNLYSISPLTDPWTQWTYNGHVAKVAQTAEELANKYKANTDYCVAGALLHDIADSVMDRHTPGFDQKSIEISHKLLFEVNFSPKEIEIILKKVIEPHSCRKFLPTTLEGKIMATADAIVHLNSDFYLFCCWNHIGAKSFDNYKAWVLEKIERDYHHKIFFEEARQSIQDNYLSLKKLFSQ